MKTHFHHVLHCIVGCLVLFGALAGSGRAEDQPPSPPGKPAAAADQGPELPSRLEDVLETGMRSNPDILAYEARVRKAEADLNQVRHRAAQAMTEAHARRERLSQETVRLRNRLEEAQRLHEVGSLSVDELGQRKSALAEAQMSLATAQADLRYLLGVGSAGVRPVKAPADAHETGSPRADDPWDRVVTFTTLGWTLADVMSDFQKRFDLIVVLDPRAFTAKNSSAIFARSAEVGSPNADAPKSMSIRAWLQAIGDAAGCVFLQRDYGALLTTQEFAGFSYKR